jgi:hypothetical protein
MTRIPLIAMAMMTTLPAYAITPDQQSRIDRFWDLSSQCTSVMAEDGMCQEMNTIHNALLAEGLCFVWGEGDGFVDCDIRTSEEPPAPQEPVEIQFNYERARSGFNALDKQDRRYLQRKMTEAGFYTYSIDGAYGPGTAEAMQSMVQMIATTQAVDIEMTTVDGVRRALGYMMTYTPLRISSENPY